ncbi:MAG: hypothetical protein ACLRXQ_11430 [Phascolarctobacterium faecium]
MMKHGYKGAPIWLTIVTVSGMLQAPDEDWMYENMPKIYIRPQSTGMVGDVNPWLYARGDFTEADQRGLWQAKLKPKRIAKSIYQ